MASVEISPGVFSVGAKDFKRKIFDRLIPLPEGTSYNSYLIRGTEKTALIDTVNPGFENELLANIRERFEPEKLDYIIMNHAEPDHANAIPFMLGSAKNAKLVVGKIGAKAAKDYYEVPDERMLVVDETAELSLGGKTLRFIDAPWLHWPETMFTYIKEDGILFPCDFFGQHLATEKTFDSEIGREKLEEIAKAYFGEIMLPFRGAGQKALAKLKGMQIKIIAPSHGVIYKNPEWIIPLYESWTSGKLAKKVIIAYVSMWGSTEKLANELERKLVEKGIPVSKYDLYEGNLGGIATDLVDSACIVLGAPTVLGGVHPMGFEAAYLVKALRPPVKYAAVVSSYGWAPAVGKAVTELFAGTQVEIVGAVEAKTRPKKEDFEKIAALADAIAGKLASIY